MYQLTHNTTGRQYGQFKTENAAWRKAMRLHQEKGLIGWTVTEKETNQ